MPIDPAASRAQLAAWRAQGRHRADPARYALLEALARRAGQHEGLARQQLEARLHALIAAYAQRLAPAAPAALPHAEPSGALRELLAQFAQMPRLDAAPASAPVLADDASATPADTAAPLLAEFQALWGRLRIDHLLQQCLASLSPDAGPLHSSVLSYRAMLLMGEVAPDYLQHFVAYVDLLSWLEPLGGRVEGGADAQPAKPGRRRKSVS